MLYKEKRDSLQYKFWPFELNRINLITFATELVKEWLNKG